MSSLALRAEGDLLADYAAYVRALGITSDCKRVRVRAAECLLALHPDLRVWTARPTRTRVADIKRTRSWPFLAWCFIHRRVLPDLDLLVSKTPGAIYADWRARYADDIARAASVAERFTWSNNWTRQVIDCLGLVCLCRGKSLE